MHLLQNLLLLFASAKIFHLLSLTAPVQLIFQEFCFSLYQCWTVHWRKKVFHFYTHPTSHLLIFSLLAMFKRLYRVQLQDNKKLGEIKPLSSTYVSTRSLRPQITVSESMRQSCCTKRSIPLTRPHKRPHNLGRSIVPLTNCSTSCFRANRRKRMDL